MIPIKTMTMRTTAMMVLRARLDNPESCAAAESVGGGGGGGSGMGDTTS